MNFCIIYLLKLCLVIFRLRCLRKLCSLTIKCAVISIWWSLEMSELKLKINEEFSKEFNRGKEKEERETRKWSKATRISLFVLFHATCRLMLGRDCSTVDGRSNRKCYWTRASCDCGRLQIGDVTREVEFLSNDYTNPNTNPSTLTTLALSLADHHDAFESFCASVFCTLYETIPAPSTVQ